MRTCAAIVICFAVGCSDEPPDPQQPVQIEVRASFGATPFACGASHDVGTPARPFRPTDLRFYVHDVRLLGAAGGEIPVELTVDGRWQLENLALLDFEDGCGDGNADENHRLIGSAPEPGPYAGIRFRVGVPFALNHGNAATAPSPLNLTAMFWSWNGGYKFLRLDGDDAWRFHLGSTGCEADPSGQIVDCATPNRTEVTLEGDPQGGVVFDVGALLADVDVASNADGTPPGCMASPDDPDCVPLFAALGLGYAGLDASTQRVFHLGGQP